MQIGEPIRELRIVPKELPIFEPVQEPAQEPVQEPVPVRR